MLGAAKINFISKFVSTATVTVLRRKLGIRANGNAAISSSYVGNFGNTSLAFDGTGDYLQISSTSDALTWNATTGYTVEYWFRASSFTIGSSPSNYPLIIGNMNQGGDTNYWSFGPASSTTIVFYYYNGSAQNRVTATVSTMSTGTWYHIAFTYSTSGTMTIWFNGTSSATGSVSGTPQFSTTEGLFVIGQVNNVGYNGYLDELRISNLARYSAGFTPSSTRFVNDANTLLLLHGDGTPGITFIEDDNGTRSQCSPWKLNNVSISTTQSKFGGTSGYINAATGSDNALQFAGYQTYETMDRFKWGNYTNYTIESWVYFTAWSSNTNATGEDSAALCGFSREGGYVDWCFGFNRTGKITLAYSTNSGYGNTTLQESTATGTLNTWYHIAFVKNGSSLKLYVNGVEKASSTLSGTVTYNAAEWFKIGQNGSAFTAYFDEFRCSSVARYTSGFTAPTEPFINDSDTILLLHCDGTNSSTVFRDDNGARAQKGIQAIGNAQISTAQSKFGGASLLLDGTGDYLSSTTPLTIGTGDWTVECWIRTGTANRVFFDNRIPTSSAGVFFLNASGFPAYYDNTTSTVAGTTNCADTTWRHIAYSKSGTTLRIFVNGTVDATYTSYSSDMGTGRSFVVGAQFDGDIPINGHIDEFRVSNTARYTANFTAPTAPFQSDANTLLLLHCDGTNTSTVFFDDNGVAPYTV
jgi:hypothetical protein